VRQEQTNHSNEPGNKL